MAITKSIVEYQITVVGKIKDVNIPSGHRYVVHKARMGGNEADDGYEVWMEIKTFKDGNHTFLLENNLIPSNNKTFPLGATKPKKYLEDIVATEFEKWLDENVGVGKWTKV